MVEEMTRREFLKATSGAAVTAGLMGSAPALPTGTVTFLFTDIEGSTHLWEEHAAAMRQALARHDAVLTAGVERHGGVVVKSRGEGDSFFAVFAHAPDALAAAFALQQALLVEPWSSETPIRVRMALHRDTADVREGDYYGAGVIRCARLRALGHGGQVLLSRAACEACQDSLPEGGTLRDLGAHRLKDLQQPEQIFQFLHPDLPMDFPPLHSVEASARNLPSGTVTILLTDIEGYAQFCDQHEQHPELISEVTARHDTLVREAVQMNGGLVYRTMGDGFFTVFTSASDALAAAVAAQRSLSAEAWRALGLLRVRMALHTGEVQVREGDYFSPTTIIRAFRLLGAAHGGQILLSMAAVEELGSMLPTTTSLLDLGEYRLRSLTRPERIFQLLHPDLPADFPPPAAVHAK